MAIEVCCDALWKEKFHIPGNPLAPSHLAWLVSTHGINLQEEQCTVMFTGVALHSAHITVALTTGSHCVGCFNSLSLSDTGLFGPVVLSGEVSKSAVNFRKSLSLHRIIIHPETVLSSHQTALPSCSFPLKAEEMSTSYLWTRQGVYLSPEAEERLST